jgi:hypothetical protein
MPGKNLARLVPSATTRVYARRTVAFEGDDILFRNVFEIVLYEIDAFWASLEGQILQRNWGVGR